MKELNTRSSRESGADQGRGLKFKGTMERTRMMSNMLDFSSSWVLGVISFCVVGTKGGKGIPVPKLGPPLKALPDHK